MNGILLVDKPSDWTSNDVVQKLRGLLRERRIGHAGTLDPMATGLLTVFVGRATRAVEFAEADAKCYRAALHLGLTTDTQDITGTVLRQQEPDVTREALEEVLERFRGEIRQVPPMYSAVKVNGERLYRLARRGETVERAARTVTIHSLDLLGREGEDWILEIRCSKGTYIRTLCHDIGDALGCGGCMAALRRLEAGCFTVDEAHTLEEIAEAASESRAERCRKESPERESVSNVESGRNAAPLFRNRRVPCPGACGKRRVPHDQILFRGLSKHERELQSGSARLF